MRPGLTQLSQAIAWRCEIRPDRQVNQASHRAKYWCICGVQRRCIGSCKYCQTEHCCNNCCA